jgi:hypothetical protein
MLIKKMSDQNSFYIYLYKDPKSGEPIYVGKGQKSRMFHHMNNSSNDRLQKTINSRLKEGYEISPVKICEAANEKHAFLLEKALIKFFGRADLGEGTLFNNTDGGDGVSNPSKEVRKKQAQAMFKRFETGKVMRFKNFDTEEIFKGSSYDLSKYIKFKSTQIRKLFTDETVNSVKGWALDSYDGSVNLYNKEYGFINVFNGEKFYGVQKDFANTKKLSYSLVSQLIKGNQSHANGWVLKGNEAAVRPTIKRTTSGKVYKIRRPWNMPTLTENSKAAYLLAGDLEEKWWIDGSKKDASVRKILNEIGVKYKGKVHNFERIFAKIKNGEFTPSKDKEWQEFFKSNQK